MEFFMKNIVFHIYLGIDEYTYTVKNELNNYYQLFYCYACFIVAAKRATGEMAVRATAFLQYTHTHTPRYKTCSPEGRYPASGGVLRMDFP